MALPRGTDLQLEEDETNLATANQYCPELPVAIIIIVGVQLTNAVRDMFCFHNWQQMIRSSTGTAVIAARAYLIPSSR